MKALWVAIAALVGPASAETGIVYGVQLPGITMAGKSATSACTNVTWAPHRTLLKKLPWEPTLHIGGEGAGHGAVRQSATVVQSNYDYQYCDMMKGSIDNDAAMRHQWHTMEVEWDPLRALLKKLPGEPTMCSGHLNWQHADQDETAYHFAKESVVWTPLRALLEKMPGELTSWSKTDL